MRKFLWIRPLVLLLLPLCAAAQAPPARTENVYDHIAARANDAQFQARLGEPASRLEEFAWLIGDWRVTVTVFATRSAPESSSEESATFRKFGDTLIADDRLGMILGFDPFAGRWLLAGFELPAAPFTHDYADWNGKSMTIEGPVRIAGEEFLFRQTFTRTGNDEFELSNEQRLADGKFHPVDRYRYRRAARAGAAAR